MPVLPLVASIRVSPGLISPRASAFVIIDTAGRSFTEPAGLLPSSLASMVLEVAPGMRFSLTRGVLPTKSSREWYMVLLPYDWIVSMMGGLQQKTYYYSS